MEDVGFATTKPTMKLSHHKTAELIDKFLLLADNTTWSRYTSFAWEELKPELLTGRQRQAVFFITYIEDHLPGYFTEYVKRFPIDETVSSDDCIQNRELYHFIVRWAQEEDRHAHVLFNYQVRAGLADVDSLRRDLAREGSKTFTIGFTEAPDVFTYTMLQEKSTFLFYQQFHNAVEEPVLKAILRLLAKDEARHFSYFMSVVGTYIEKYGEQMLPRMKEVVRQFGMPLHNTLTNYKRLSLIVQDAAGGYDHTESFEELKKVINKFADAETRSKSVTLTDFVQSIRTV